MSTNTSTTETCASQTSDEELIGQSLSRVQDDRMLRGQGWYVDDVPEAGMLHAAILRSPFAAGRITEADTADAESLPGVHLVLGPDQLDGAFGTIPCPWLLPGQQEVDLSFYSREVRYVGQPLAIVVADSRALAEDALELIDIDIDEVAAVASLEAARAPDAPLVRPEYGSNQIGQIHFGDPVDDLEAVISSAPVVVDMTFTLPRIGHNSMEPRGLIADWNSRLERLDVHSSTQVPHMVRQEVARALDLRVDQVCVVATDVGGAFGLKTRLFPDEALVCLTARRLGRKVKWIEDRAESFVASHHGRGQESRARIALDEDGTFLALHVDMHGDLGAEGTSATSGSGPFQVAGLMVEGPYRYSRAAGATVTGWYTNRVPTGAFRGYGMPEATFIRERLIDEAARITGRAPAELRLHNMYQSDELPVVTRLAMPYDSGDYPKALQDAVTRGRDFDSTSTDRVRRGVGYASSTEITGFAPTGLAQMLQIHWSTWDSAKVRINEDGSVTVFSGVTTIGQGIETSLTQIAAQTLGVPASWVSVQLGDTDTSGYSNMGSQASRGLTTAGPALLSAATRLRQRMNTLAGSALEVPAEEVVLDGDEFTTADGAKRIAWSEVAHNGWMGWGRGQQDAIALEEVGEYDPASIAYAYATHAALVAVNLDTGKVDLEAYWIAHDAGVLVNPMIVDGQMIGGAVQGIGAALLEEATYSPEGQPTATTYLDYALPMSEDVPDVVVDHLVTPSPITPGGFKGVGEGGTIPASAAVANAVAAAVPEIAEHVTTIPLVPGRVWGLLDDAGLTR
ncbi:xanthine dehydrogenase family protein molybdopterin-binding subunit [Janibacter sp. LM]|uniref:xanthine dehydrogenase family protein molybdopterin-binding subunit n=1 Tax=Janibacter sp. LM TaxID=3144845 RepID=UPI0031F6DAC4